MTTQIQNGNLIITIPLANPAPLTKEGRSYLVASTHGWVRPDGLLINGGQVSISLNAVVPVRAAAQSAPKLATQYAQ